MTRLSIWLLITFLIGTAPSAEGSQGDTVRPINVTVGGKVTPPVVAPGEPIPLVVTASNGLSVPVFHSTYSLKSNEWNGETCNVSLVDIYRNGKQFNLYLARPEIEIPYKVAGVGGRVIEPGKSLRIETDARKWKLRDGWLPGRYQVTVRVDGLKVDPYYRLSVLSDPFEFEISSEDIQTSGCRKSRCAEDAATIRGLFRPTKDEFFSDEPITVEMVVYNNGAAEFRFDKGGDYRFGNGRHDRFFMAFGGSHGKYASAGGGLLGVGTVPANGVYRQVIDLTPWGPPGPDDQGVIRVTCRRTLSTRVTTKLLVDCLERQPIDYTRRDARAVLIAEMARLNEGREGFPDEKEKRKEIERVVDLYMGFPQIQSTVECKVSGRLKEADESEQEQALDQEVRQASSEMVNGLRIFLAAKTMPDGQPKLRIQFTNEAWDPFDIVACPLFLEVQDEQGHWRAFQHPRWGSETHEGPETLELAASISETEPVSAFTSLPPGKNRVRVSIAVDRGMAGNYESARIWTGTARSNAVIVEIPSPDGEAEQPVKQSTTAVSAAKP